MKKIICLVVCLGTIISTILSQTKNFIDQPYIEVAGYADTAVTPNEIYIRIVISERDSKDKIPVEVQEGKMIVGLKGLNINTEKDLTTSDMLSNYRYYFLKHKDILKSKEYILKVTDAETASKVFIQLEDIGISNTSINSVDHSDLETIKNECRIKAIENAQKKAIALTKPIMQTVGNAIHITDNETNFDNLLKGRVAGVQINGYGSLDKRKYEAPKIEFEKIKVSATISAKFILK